jgi:hypothetical protein
VYPATSLPNLPWIGTAVQKHIGSFLCNARDMSALATTSRDWHHALAPQLEQRRSALFHRLAMQYSLGNGDRIWQIFQRYPCTPKLEVDWILWFRHQRDLLRRMWFLTPEARVSLHNIAIRAMGYHHPRRFGMSFGVSSFLSDIISFGIDARHDSHLIPYMVDGVLTTKEVYFPHHHALFRDNACHSFEPNMSILEHYDHVKRQIAIHDANQSANQEPICIRFYDYMTMPHVSYGRFTRRSRHYNRRNKKGWWRTHQSKIPDFCSRDLDPRKPPPSVGMPQTTTRHRAPCPMRRKQASTR